MSDLPHLRIEGTQEASKYTPTRSGPAGVVFQVPARNKPAHARRLSGELKAAGTASERMRAAKAAIYPGLIHWQPDGIVLTFKSDANHELKLESLERPGAGIYLLSLAEIDGCQVAKVYVPEDKLANFLRIVDQYAASVVLVFTTDPANVTAIKSLEDAAKQIRFRGPVRERDGVAYLKFIMPDGEAANFEARVRPLATLLSTSRPNDQLVGSIASVRLALIEDFWQDRIPFPPAEKEMWWEIWLRGNRSEAVTVHGRFTEIAGIVGITNVSDRHVAFPERIVVHAFATARQLSESIDLFAMLAELRQAKELATLYIDLPAREQAAVVSDLVKRLILPGPDAPSVCVLDGGVNRGHPLIAPILAEADTHAVDRAWGVSDHDKDQHGTGIAELRFMDV